METKFDWYKELESAISRKPTTKKRNLMIDKSFDWVTCACGQSCKDIPRDSEGVPNDTLLQALGCEFSEFIQENNYWNAIYTLNRIEIRTSYLLDEINLNSKK